MTKPYAVAPVPVDGLVGTAFPTYTETTEHLRWALPAAFRADGAASMVHSSMVQLDGATRVVVDASSSKEWRAYQLDQVVVVDEFNAPLPKE
jgi:hypothetical protein